MNCKDCGGDLEYIGDAVIGNEKKLMKKTSLFACKICDRVYRGIMTTTLQVCLKNDFVKNAVEKSNKK